MTRRPPRVSILVVTYNGAAHLTGCIESIVADGDEDAELHVLDNASTDRSALVLEDLRQRHPRMRVHSSPENLGYAGAVNHALPRLAGEYVAVLNTDLVVDRGWLDPLVSFLDEHPRVAAVNPAILLADGARINAMGQRVHVTGLGFNQGLGREAASFGEHPFPISGLHGAAFLIRRRALEELGGMNAAGFMYHEDVNLSWLLRMRGHDLYCVPRARVRHDYHLTMYPEKLRLLEQNRLALLATYLEKRTMARLLPWLAATEAMVWGYALLRGSAFLAAKRDGYRWLITHRHELSERRRWATSKRLVSDREVLAALCRDYDLAQMITLAGERGASSRVPRDGLRRGA